MKCKARNNGCHPGEAKMVNFCIFVVDGLAVLKSMEDDGDAEKQYNQIIKTAFNCPYLSFKGIWFSIFLYHFVGGRYLTCIPLQQLQSLH